MTLKGATTVKASTFYWVEPACESNCAIPGMGFCPPGTGTIALASTPMGAWATYPNRPKGPPSGEIGGFGLCYGTGSVPDNSLAACPGALVAITGPSRL